MYQKKPVVLMILDGWGYSSHAEHNAIHAANIPQWNDWWNSCPHTLLTASGLGVGLPDGQMGNSEVGHMHIGAGRVIHQDFTRINDAIADGTFAKNPVLNEMITALTASKKALHIMGLLSDGGVHSHEQHLFSFLKLCAERGFTTIYLHLFLDGRDTPPRSALDSLERLEHALKNCPGAIIASISGRYFAMDRDKRWERIIAVYNMLIDGTSIHRFSDARTAISAYYEADIDDEFIPPTLIGAPVKIQSGDGVFFFNFRADRARQLTEAFVSPEFNGFSRPNQLQLSYFVSMTNYAKNLLTWPAFPAHVLTNSLGEIVAEHGLNQLRIAETEKYAHVTFFFNGGSEHVFPNEDRILIPSPSVATYDLKPQMSAPELTDALVAAITSDAYDLIICNYANADMVGHTGNFAATIEAIECLDRCMKQVGDALKHVQGCLIITSDHGNAEMMFDTVSGQAHTAHSTEPVPFLFIGEEKWAVTSNRGSLIDIAPTILTLLNITIPPEMTGVSLLSLKHE